MKRLVGWILIAVMLLTALPAMADNVRTSGDFQYTIKGNGTATIVGYTGTSRDIILPNLIDGYVITAIGDSAFAWFDYYYDEEHCPSWAYGDGDGTVTLTDTITSIGEKAFWGFPITTINIPDSVEYIGYGAFAHSECDFRISNNHPHFAVIDGSLYNKTEKELLHGCTDAVIPEGIVSIGDYAYYDTWDASEYGEDEKRFQFPSTLKRIGNYAYASASHMPAYGKEISFPEGLTYIGDYAFSNMYLSVLSVGDISFKFPSSITYIGEGAFQRTEDVGEEEVSFYFSSNTILDKVGAYAFAVNADTYGPFNHVYLKGQVKEYGNYAFSQADVSGSMNGVEIIGDYAFEKSRFHDSSAVVIPSSCRSIGEGAFQGAEIDKLTIQDGVETIDSKAFYDLHLKEAVHLPESLQNIALDAFDKKTTLIVEKGSYAKRWADDNAFTYTINGEEQNLDWLNN